MQPEDLPDAMRLKEAEGWNQTEADWRFMLLDPRNHCLVAEAGGFVAGTAVAVSYGDRLYWIGMVLVDQNFRGRGIGKQLLLELIRKVGSKGVVKLDATPDGRKVYEKLGFSGEYELFRMVNLSVDAASGEAGAGGVEFFRSEDTGEIVRLDREVFGVERSGLINHLLRMYPAHVRVLRQGGRLTGFVLGREGSRYFQAGLLCASSFEGAGRLLESALAVLSGRAVVMDVPEQQTALIRWLEERGFVRQRSFLRMYLKENLPAGRMADQYLVCGPEFG